MKEWKDLVSTRFGVVLVVLWFISKIAEANPDIAERCIYVMGALTLAHIVSRTFTNGNKKLGDKAVPEGPE